MTTNYETPQQDSPEEVNPASIKIKSDISGTPEQAARLSKIMSVVEKVVNSEEFKQRVLSATYSSPKADSVKFYQDLVGGAEKVTGSPVVTDNTWNIQWVFQAKKYSDVTGWTYGNTHKIWINSQKWKSRTDRAVGGTVCHEYSHKLGYGHNSAKSHNSAPYSVGTICSELYPKFE